MDELKEAIIWGLGLAISFLLIGAAMSIAAMMFLLAVRFAMGIGE